MEWPEDIVGELPAHRSDEPPELRGKILAELRDHLETALQREQLCTPDPAQARRNVWKRFGDPVGVARKLWFDAMWEKIMGQRGMLVALAAMVLVSVGSMGLTWHMVAEAARVNQAILDQNRVVNESILSKLQALGNTSSETANPSPDWSHLRFRATFERSGGTPAAGVKIGIQGQAFAGGSPAELERTTGPDGIADFGLVRTGQYLVQVELPSGQATADVTSFGLFQIGGYMITLLPGPNPPQELICPSPPEETDISLAVDWPQELSGRQLWLIGEFALQPQESAGHRWAGMNTRSQFTVIDSTGALMNPDMRRFGKGTASTGSFFPETEGFYQDEESRQYLKKPYKTFVDVPGIYRFGGQFEKGPVSIWLPKAPAISQLKWPSGTYALSRIIVGRDALPQDASLPDDVLHPEFLGAIELGEGDEAHDRLVYPSEDRAQNSRRRRREVKADISPFVAIPGQRNDWRLSIPARLVDVLTEPEVAKRNNTVNAAAAPAVYSRPAPTAPAPRNID